MMLLVVISQLIFVVFGLPEGDPVSSALCRTECLHQHLESGAIEDRDCAIQPDCFLCWEHCGILSKSNISQEKLCKDEHCSEGCQTACSFFKENHPPSKEALVFPNTPTLNDGILEWDTVPNAELYSVSLVYLNRSMRNVGQTVSCKFRIPKSQLSRVTRIVVIAVNNSGALGIINYNILRRIVKKNVSTTILKLKEVEVEHKGTLNFPPIHNPVLWLSEHETVKVDETLVKTTITWNFINSEKYKGNHEYLLKWWIPDLNMEGKSVINGSQTTELTHLNKYICLVKVKVMGTELESQILVLKKDNLELKTPKNNLVINCILFSSILSLFMISIVLSKFINKWKFSELKQTKEKSSPFYNV